MIVSIYRAAEGRFELRQGVIVVAVLKVPDDSWISAELAARRLGYEVTWGTE